MTDTHQKAENTKKLLEQIIKDKLITDLTNYYYVDIMDQLEGKFLEFFYKLGLKTVTQMPSFDIGTYDYNLIFLFDPSKCGNNRVIEKEYKENGFFRCPDDIKESIQ